MPSDGEAWREGDRCQWVPMATAGDTAAEGTILSVGAHAVRVRWDDGLEGSYRIKNEPRLQRAPGGK